MIGSALILLSRRTQRAWAIVDIEDFHRFSLRAWYLNSGGYAARKAPRFTANPDAVVLMHREVLGSAADGLVSHHTNGDKLDNRRENLVALTEREHGALHGRPRRAEAYA